MNKLKIKGFTLVELIIVITILVILATIAFVSFNGYSKTARDSSRITTIKNISKGIDSFFIKTGNVPNVDNQSSTGYIGGETLTYVGNIGENITNLIGMGEIPKDPLTGNNYVYGIDVNKKKYQIGGVIEDGIVSKVEGNYNGLLRTNTKVYNIPSLIFNGSGNLTSDETRYIIEGGKNIAYSIDNKELNNTETGLTTLKILTNNENVNSITGITIPSSLTGYTLSGTEYSSILGYNVDTIGISIFGNQYLLSVIQWKDNDLNCNMNDISISLNGINQVWAPCNSTLGNGFEWGKKDDGSDGIISSCYNYGVISNTGNCSIGNIDMLSKSIAKNYFDLLYTTPPYTNLNGDKEYNNIWGKLYTYSGAQNACPNGRRLPSDQDFKNLEIALGCNISEINRNGTRGCAGLGWKNNGIIANLLKITLPGYRRLDNTSFHLRGDSTRIWSSTIYGTGAYGRKFDHHNNGIIRDVRDTNLGYSVRCIKN